LSKENISEVLSRTSGGGISVSGVSSTEARVEVYIRSNNGRELSKEEIKRKLEEDYSLNLTVSGNKLTATAEPKDDDINWKQALSISFKIFVPQNVSTDLNTSGGGIELTNLSGTHDFSTSGGGLRISKLGGKTRGKTSGGGISVSDTKGEIRLHTSGGRIDASHCSGQITLKTSGGSINLEELDGTIEAETSGGPVRGRDIKGVLSARTSGGGIVLKGLACSVDASTSGGNMEVEITELGKFVTVSNSGGNVTLEMPGSKGVDLKLRGNKIRTNNLRNFDGDHEDERITGKINGGGIPVTVQTSGSITLELK
jgi:DUF4097 and DUF4098 domain-containing protein YvlB